MKIHKLISQVQKSGSKCLEFTVLTLLFWLIVPLIVIIASPLYIFRFFVRILVKIVCREWTDIMNIRDAFVSEHMNKKQLNSITTFLFVLNGPPADVTVKEFQEKFQNLISTEKEYEKLKFYSENWLGYPFWKIAKNIDMSNHIRQLNLTLNEFNPISESIQMEKNEEEFYSKFLGPILTKPFERNRPPWEIIVVPIPKSMPSASDSELTGFNIEISSKSALVFRFHHSLSDGFSFFNLICKHFAGISDPVDIPQPPKDEKLTLWGRCRQLLESALMTGYIQSKFFILNRDWAEWHRPVNKLKGETHAVIVTPDPVPLKDLREISKKFKVSPTAILFSAVAGGIQRFLKANGIRDQDIPNSMRGHFPWPRPNHPMHGLVNHWTFVTMKFLLKSQNSLSRLKEMGHNFESLKNSPIPRVSWNFVPIYTALPNGIKEIFGTNRTSTLTLSSFPGPKNQIVFLNKWKVNDMMFWLPRLRGNPSMQVGILSYNGNFQLTLAVDKAIIEERKDVKIFAQCIYDELKWIQGCF